jgi:hypothetical protein
MKINQIITVLLVLVLTFNLIEGCIDNCDTCMDSTTCSSCSPGYFYYNVAPLTFCDNEAINGYWQNPTTRNYEACSLHC